MSNPEELDVRRQDVIEAAIAYCLGTFPDDHPLDHQLRGAVARLTQAAESAEGEGEHR